MKRRWILRASILLLLAFLIGQPGAVAYAHTSSQEGILEKTYLDRLYGEYYGKYFIGGDTVGWRIMEDRHTNGTIITYSLNDTDPAFTGVLKNYVRAGANMWAGTVSIIEATNGTGYIYAHQRSDSDAGAEYFVPYKEAIDSNGHVNEWKIEVNLKYKDTINATTLAHEFGHAIGLTDLYANKSKNKLMYGTAACTVTSPTSLDRWGAKVITGQHVSHAWGYRYYDTPSGGANRHVKYCTQCNGNSTVVANCVYNAQNICKICGVAYGTMPYSTGVETELS